MAHTIVHILMIVSHFTQNEVQGPAKSKPTGLQPDILSCSSSSSPSDPVMFHSPVSGHTNPWSHHSFALEYSSQGVSLLYHQLSAQLSISPWSLLILSESVTLFLAFLLVTIKSIISIISVIC